jgi:hypothetical protein
MVKLNFTCIVYIPNPIYFDFDTYLGNWIYFERLVYCCWIFIVEFIYVTWERNSNWYWEDFNEVWSSFFEKTKCDQAKNNDFLTVSYMMIVMYSYNVQRLTLCICWEGVII